MPWQRATSGRGAGVPAALRAAAVVLGCLLLTAVTAFVATVTHQGAVTGPGGVRWPVGLGLALALTACVGAFLRALGPSLAARLAALGGWLLVLAWVSSGSAGEDVLVPANGRGYAWLFAGLVLLAALLLLPGRVARAARG
ncbi:hypothetical protein [Angustibacter luteus]|uniref:Uncharacterized protein n=1 Tax=Angustibacter luteus TaxID=658456 RepID=A0ABW1JHX0_9ACTN